MLIGFTQDDAFSSDGDLDAIGDADLVNNEGPTTLGLKIISVRTVIAFLCLGSFTVYFVMFSLPWWAAVLIGIAVGGVAGLLMGLAINALAKMQTSGNIDINNCVGKTGEVYLTIPASRAGMGKVNVLVQERLSEFAAVTDSPEPIKTGAGVRILDVSGEHVLVVEPF